MFNFTKHRPNWHKPVGDGVATLRIKNSLTQRKEDFYPAKENQVSWYSCGPTVYDKAHVGHARSYVTFDVMRRLLLDYFNYDVLYVMNITDIDDKIIKAARRNHLLESFKRHSETWSVSELCDKIEKAWHAYVQIKLDTYHGLASLEDTAAFTKSLRAERAENVEKEPLLEMHMCALEQTAIALLDAKAQLANGTLSHAQDAGKAKHKLLEASQAILMEHLESEFGDTVTEPAIFRAFASHWEDQFWKDMDKLNVRRPDLVTRVSDYIVEIVKFIEQIEANGFCYEADGSVYFDTVAFESWTASESSDVQDVQNGQDGQDGPDGQGQDGPCAKKDSRDFALWKRCKPGEPVWASKWGPGRPGWHIECSAMASHIFGDKIDIHSGGIDLCFPHHHNELLQTEAHYKCTQWVNYFIHAGHLHIDARKMSKSLKNFISIEEMLETFTPSQFRLMVLIHSWDSTLDYSHGSMLEAKAIETTINNFLTTVKALVLNEKMVKAANGQQGRHQERHNFCEAEKDLLSRFQATKSSIHAAICDSFDTVTVFVQLRDLISFSHNYWTNRSSPNCELLDIIATYIFKLLRTLGFYPTETNTQISAKPEDREDQLMIPLLQKLSSFRDAVRSIAKCKGDYRDLLKLADRLRDEDLVEFGVALEDQSNGRALVRLVDKDTLIKQRNEKRVKAENKGRVVK